MLVAETVARIRREIFVKGKSFKEIMRDLKEQVENQVGLVRERFLTGNGSAEILAWLVCKRGIDLHAWLTQPLPTRQRPSGGPHRQAHALDCRGLRTPLTLRSIGAVIEALRATRLSLLALVLA